MSNQTTAPSAQTAPSDRSTSFQAVSNEAEQHSGTTLLVEAYSVLWVILMAWLLLMWRKASHLHQRVDDLERAIDAKADGAGTSPGSDHCPG
jgi:hypothetical protein